MDNRHSFRGIDKYTKQWVYGYLIVDDLKRYWIIETTPRVIAQYQDNMLIPYIKYHEVVPETVGQATGSTDIEDKNVFEYDIVQMQEEGYFYRAVVKWDECGMYYLDPINEEEWIEDWNFQDDIERFKVVGSIHDSEVK